MTVKAHRTIGIIYKLVYANKFFYSITTTSLKSVLIKHSSRAKVRPTPVHKIFNQLTNNDFSKVKIQIVESIDYHSSCDKQSIRYDLEELLKYYITRDELDENCLNNRCPNRDYKERKNIVAKKAIFQFYKAKIQFEN